MKKILKGNLMIFTLEMISFGKITIFRTLITTENPMVERFYIYRGLKSAKNRLLGENSYKMRMFLIKIPVKFLRKYELFPFKIYDIFKEP